MLEGRTRLIRRWALWAVGTCAVALIDLQPTSLGWRHNAPTFVREGPRGGSVMWGGAWRPGYVHCTFFNGIVKMVGATLPGVILQDGGSRGGSNGGAVGFRWMAHVYLF